MASVSASHLILFIASLTIAASVAGTFTNSVGRIASSIDDRSIDVSRAVETDVEVISDAGSTVYNRSGNENITLLVKNTGSADLRADSGEFDVVVDGKYVADITVTVVDGSTWSKNNVVELSIHAPSLPTGDHRVKIVVNEDEEVFSFRT